MRRFLFKCKQSIAFIPSLMALGYALIAIAIHLLPTSWTHPDIDWLIVQDNDDTLNVLLTLILGIFTIIVFSYSMVMNAITTAISVYSARLVPMLLRDKAHQLILGSALGTLVFMLIQVVAVTTEIPGNQITPLITPLSVLFTIATIVIFAYFLHHASDSVQVNYVLHRAYTTSHQQLDRVMQRKNQLVDHKVPSDFQVVLRAQRPGYVQPLDIEHLLKRIGKKSQSLQVIPYPGQFVNCGDPLLATSDVSCWSPRALRNMVIVAHNVPLDLFDTGIKHLTEVAVKAQSSAINDPGTTLTALDYLSQALIDRIPVPNFTGIKTGDQTLYITHLRTDFMFEWTVRELDSFIQDDPIVVARYEAMLKRIAYDGDRHGSFKEN